MLVRLLIFFTVALLLFLPFNWITYRQLVRIHPRRRRIALALLIAGNLMWPFFLVMRTSTDFARVTRAVFGPIWFAWTSFALVYAGVLFLILLAWIPFRRRRPFHEFARWPSRVFLWIVLIGSVVGFYQAIVPLRVERVPVRVPDLPPSLHGTRLALLGDLHVGLFTRPSRLDTIFTTTASLRPDAVLIAGDMVDDDPYFVPKLLAGTRTLPASIPLLAVLGNHEIYGNPRAIIDRMRGSRIRLLVNEGFLLRDLWIAGVGDRASSQMPGTKQFAPDLAKALSGRPANATALVLSHQPTIIDDARRHAVPVALCAHTHGGQMGFRPLRWSLAGVFLPYHMGLYDLPPTRLYINTGTGYWLLPFRLGMTPEITLIELQP
jgi:predicted MPP superfamily phosphohydrolase